MCVSRLSRLPVFFFSQSQQNCRDLGYDFDKCPALKSTYAVDKNHEWLFAVSTRAVSKLPLMSSQGKVRDG